MKLRMLFFVILLNNPVFLTEISARPMPRQRIEIPPLLRNQPVQNNAVELDMSYDFAVTGETHQVSFTVVLPTTIPDRQKIISIKYSPKPERFFNSNGNRYAQYVFDEPGKQIKIEIKVKAELYRYDLNTAKRNRIKNNADASEFADFLVHEKYIEKDDPEIQQVAGGIEGKTEEEIAKNIYGFVIEHMEYIKHGRKETGAVMALREGKGDCSEYADLFAALCRAKNIPARVITGYTLRSDSDSPKHNWVEVYLHDYGWVPFDPSWGDVENPGIQNMAFSRMGTVYVYLSAIRNDNVLQNYHYASYRYRGDRVTLKDSIELKRLDSPFSK